MSIHDLVRRAYWMGYGLGFLSGVLFSGLVMILLLASRS